MWLVKTVGAALGLYALAASTLIIGMTEADSWTLAAIGVAIGATVEVTVLLGWARSSRDPAWMHNRLGRAYWPVVIGVPAVIFGSWKIGGNIGAFTASFCAGFLAVTAVWFTVYVLRNWSLVRARMGGDAALADDLHDTGEG